MTLYPKFTYENPKKDAVILYKWIKEYKGVLIFLLLVFIVMVVNNK